MGMQALEARLGAEHGQAVGALQQQQELQAAVMDDLVAGIKADCQSRITGGSAVLATPTCACSALHHPYSGGGWMCGPGDMCVFPLVCVQQCLLLVTRWPILLLQRARWGRRGCGQTSSSSAMRWQRSTRRPSRS